MTKIHVVTATYTTHLGWEGNWIAAVYTNEKLAQSMANYFNLKAIREDVKKTYKVETWNISQLDWSEDYKILSEELPY